MANFVGLDWNTNFREVKLQFVVTQGLFASSAKNALSKTKNSQEMGKWKLIFLHVPGANVTKSLFGRQSNVVTHKCLILHVPFTSAWSKCYNYSMKEDSASYTWFHCALVRTNHPAAQKHNELSVEIA
jgi:hypothetical protein